MSRAEVRIPLSRLELDDEVRERVAAALESGAYILGPECRAFEQELAAQFGVTHATLVANATAGLGLVLAALRIGPGDEVLVPSHTAFPTIEPIFHVGATPMFIDTDAHHGMDPNAVAAALGPRSRAILPVHLFGQPCQMDAILALAERHALPVIEDCAQAHGARWRGRPVGSLGRAAVLSFYPSKNLPVPGDGGAVLTDDGRLAERVRMLRNHGRRDKHTHEVVGHNLRFNDLQAAAGRVFLRRLEARNQARRRIAAIYRERLARAPLELPAERDGAFHVYHLFAIETPERDALAKYLAARGIETGIHYPIPNHVQPGTRARVSTPAPHLPHTEESSERLLSLPMFPSLRDDEVERVCAAVLGFFGDG
jgi:dTDP-4-amino-4,6-dideoxygalactose transaminase